MLGVPTDINSSYRRGAAYGPEALRKAWRRYADFGNGSTESGLELGIDFDLQDRGDVLIEETAAD
ncbi:MAG: arginase family protein, partial [Gammaproteobacteria bacterium]|nr:arginase family protein [Gammaproteobacteria bacterium]